MDNPPKFDLYPLSLLRLVAKHRGFTAASKEAGLSQSALTRQVQALEQQIGTQLLERTTRSVSLTEAGAVLLRETEALPHILEGALRRIREEILESDREIRVGLSSSLSQAHIPGIFHAHSGTRAEIRMIVSQGSDDKVMHQVTTSKLDLGIIAQDDDTPDSVHVTHEMTDDFCVVSASAPKLADAKDFRSWANAQTWLLPPSGSTTRRRIERWAQQNRVKIAPAMELESFDLMNQLAGMAMGCAFVPKRSVSLMPQKHKVNKLKLPTPLTRQLLAITPRHGRIPEHVNDFVSGILFS